MRAGATSTRRSAGTRKAIELNPNDPETYAGLANVLLFMNRADEALELMRKALAARSTAPARSTTTTWVGPFC